MSRSFTSEQRRALFQTLFNHSSVAMGVVRPDGALVLFNRTLCDFLGYTEAELLSLNLFDLTHPEDRAFTEAQFRKAGVGEETPFSYEKRYLHKSGKVVCGLVSGAWIVDADEGPCGVAFIQDITARRESEILLRESERHYRLLFEANPLPMWIFDMETLRFLAVNDAAVRHYGYSREEFLLLTVEDIKPHGSKQELLDAVSREEVDRLPTLHRRKDGSLIEVEIYANNIEFAGRSARIAVAHDVTDKRRAEERIRLDAAALMSTRDAVLIVDRTPRVLSVNPAFSGMTGYSESEILGAHPRLLFSSRQERGSYAEIWTSLGKEGFWQGEFWGRRRSAETFPGWLTLSAVRNCAGEATHFVGVITDLTRLKKSEERLQRLANHDALTDLPRRQLFESMVEHALERARRKGKQVALLVLDFDQFKAVNETFGHKAGDDLLVAVARRLRGRVRVEDALSRLSGDRFAFMLEGIKDLSSVDVVVRNLQSVLEEPFSLQDTERVVLRASFGISIFPQDGGAARELLHGADAAVNLAKERGGGQFRYCTPELNAQARMRLELQSALRRALEREEFILHYQPKVDLRTGRITGAEALLRWASPDRGMVPPLHFIPLSEKNGLIVPIGNWVIDEVCRQIREWSDAGLQNIRVSVNVSARQFRTGDLEAQVSAALQRSGIPPERLMLELTESMLMDDPEEAIRRMEALRRIGVRISLDDFGTGYSSLEYLGRFPIDQLKIDRSFIQEIVTDPNSATISTSVIALAHRMRLRVVAEGVETEAQLGYLRQNGCDEMQGFYFSKPLPPGEFAELYRRGASLAMSEDRAALPSLLVVDDDPEVLAALKRVFAGENFIVLTAGNAREGFDLLAGNIVQVIVTDLRMPEMSGAEFLRKVRALHPDTVHMVLSEYADLPAVMELINEGDIYRLLTKPWDNDQLRRHVREAFRLQAAKVRRS